MEAEEKAGEGGSPLINYYWGAWCPCCCCAIFDVGELKSESVRIKSPRIYVLLVVGPRVMGWAGLFYDLKLSSYGRWSY